MIKRILRHLKRAGDRLLGTVVDEWYWRARSTRWAEQYLSPVALTHPHRRLLIDAVARHTPFATALEVGCASGPNLYLLAKRFPQVRWYGIDINHRAIRTGNAFFQSHGLRQVTLLQAAADRLDRFSDQSMDLVFTDATLICIGPDKIRHVLREFRRVARRAVILVEWHSPATNVPNYQDHWLYNWCPLLKECLQPTRLILTKITSSLWGGDWARYGYVIDAELSPRHEKPRAGAGLRRHDLSEIEKAGKPRLPCPLDCLFTQRPVMGTSTSFPA